MNNILLIYNKILQSSFINNIINKHDPIYNYAQNTSYFDKFNSIYFMKNLNPGYLFNTYTYNNYNIQPDYIKSFDGIILIISLSEYFQYTGKIQRLCDQIRLTKPLLCVIISNDPYEISFPHYNNMKYMIYYDMKKYINNVNDLYLYSEAFYWFINKINQIIKQTNNNILIKNKSIQQSIQQSIKQPIKQSINNYTTYYNLYLYLSILIISIIGLIKLSNI